jgi:coenzyme PQQ precursor peptide PqqA
MLNRGRPVETGQGKETFASEKKSQQLNMEARADMTWTTPVITEVCIGMEVTSYLSAEI